jgi:hypothetical protein
MKLECEVCGSDLHVNIEEAPDTGGITIVQVSEPVVTITCAQNITHVISIKLREFILKMLRKNRMI